MKIVAMAIGWVAMNQATCSGSVWQRDRAAIALRRASVPDALKIGSKSSENCFNSLRPGRDMLSKVDTVAISTTSFIRISGTSSSRNRSDTRKLPGNTQGLKTDFTHYEQTD